MEDGSIIKTREIWIDSVKVIACILVVLGHFFQSMTKANVLPSNDLYLWFNQTIYYFHVPLFFICSGYLYQYLSKDEDYSKTIFKKAVNLGIPYFTFSFITWILKTLFSKSVNAEIGGLADTVFIHPTAPYWYLYALFFIFVVTPVFKNKSAAICGIAVALVFKVWEIILGGYKLPIISYVISNEVWFVIGMCLSIFKYKIDLLENRFKLSASMVIVFIVLSIFLYISNIRSGLISFFMGFIACCSIIMLFMIIYKNGYYSRLFDYLGKYTMPIFLMHTLFAAPVRILLLKINIHNVIIHVGLGLAISFIGPIFAAELMKKSRWLEIMIYPYKLIKIR